MIVKSEDSETLAARTAIFGALPPFMFEAIVVRGPLPPPLAVAENPAIANTILDPQDSTPIVQL